RLPAHVAGHGLQVELDRRRREDDDVLGLRAEHGMDFREPLRHRQYHLAALPALRNAKPQPGRAEARGRDLARLVDPPDVGPGGVPDDFAGLLELVAVEARGY